MTSEESVKAACPVVCGGASNAPPGTPHNVPVGAEVSLCTPAFEATEEAILCLREDIKGVITDT